MDMNLQVFCLKYLRVRISLGIKKNLDPSHGLFIDRRDQWLSNTVCGIVPCVTIWMGHW